MASIAVSRDFDELSSVYDETREPLETGTIHGLRDFLTEHRMRSILEVGVGTGRVARPLVELGVKLCGIDASRGMLGRAAAKGLPYLVRGNAYRLPFPDRSFDATLFVHVLHLLDRPDDGLNEAARVSRHGVLAVLDLPPPGEKPERAAEDEPRRILREILKEAGFPEMLRAGPRAREQEILRSHPPTELRVLLDREVTEPLSKRIDRIEKRAYRHVLRIPPEALAAAVSEARARVGTRTVTHRRREAVAWWSFATGEAAPPP
jgi:ubiquinone/menaquinone biosynthesis C-methylase UbiE